MKNKRWYKQLLMSHFATMLIAGAVIISIVVVITYRNYEKEVEAANQAYTSQVVEGMEGALKNIELMLANQIVKNEAINNYLSETANETSLINYRASGEIVKIRNNPLIHSIYLYRYRDQKVLTSNYISTLEEFPDHAFILESLDKPLDATWSPIRLYTEFPLIDPAERVISITKRSVGSQGVIVLNVKAELLLSMANQFQRGNQSYMDIVDSDNQVLYSTASAAISRDQALTGMESGYVGWRFISGTYKEARLSQAAMLALGPLLAILLALAVIIAFIMWIIRKSYRPIEQIVRRAASYQSELHPPGSDEFSIIENAFDSMLIQIDLMDQHQAETSKVKRKQFFMELQEEDYDIQPDSFIQYRSLFGMGEDEDCLYIAILEIDKYVPLLQNNRTGLLLSKERLAQAAENLSERTLTTLCLDWTSGDRLSVLVQVVDDGTPSSISSMDVLAAALERLRQWCVDELAFSVTIGVGAEALSLSCLKNSYHTARQALQYKMTAGNNRVIVYEQIQGTEHEIPSMYYKWLDDLVLHFRIPSPQWREDFALIFDHLEERVLKNEDMQLILNYFMHRFAREMEEISPEINEYWQQTTYTQLLTALRTLETTIEIRNWYEQLISELYDKYAEWLSSAQSKPLIYEVRKYIEDNYTNPDLSLNHISDRFGMNGKYVSQLFKEAFGVKFVDFLIGLRLEHAQRQLRETNISIYEIARQVGYEHAISFGRIFKKIVGVSPGDYRKMMVPGRTPSTTQAWESSTKNGF